MATTARDATGAGERELVPFKVVAADGRTIELEYSSPRAAESHDELAVLESLPWFEPGKPLHNWMLHETDFYDEVEQIWGRRWGAEGIGTLREVLVSRPTENETRPEYAREWQYYYSTAAGNADLGRLQEQFDAYYEVLEGNGVRGFSTPLATLHKFDGWADKFLTTPPNGLERRYVTLGYTTKGVGFLETLAATAVYHQFDSNRLNLDYGSEVDLQLQAKYQRFNFLLKYADYNADRFATDTHKYWVQLDYVW